MWSRNVEMMLGVWLSLSPFIFGHPDEKIIWWINDFACALLIVTIALLAYWGPLRRIHLLSVGIALWLIGFGYFSAPYPTPPALQNHILVGLLLAMFAIVPSHASQPSLAWRQFEEQRAERDDAGE